MSRPFRPRPLDIHKKLPIVKSVKDLDNDEASAVSRLSLHNATGYSDIEPVPAPPSKRRAGEIPTPQFVVVDSYERDYLRTFIQPSSYVRGRGSRSEAAECVEYDIDNEDDDWLQQLNRERTILPPESFEWLLYKLELLDYKARERAGAIPAVYGVPVPVLLQEDAAFEVLRSQIPRPAVISAVFDYWKVKREQWQKPVLRRLQPPPPVNDTNPFNVFRPREKIHRPHTRRMQRRENDVLSFEKLRQVRFNLEQARALLGMLQKREEKKRELLDCEANLQRTRIILKHDTELDDELVMDESTPISTPFSRKSADLLNGHLLIHPSGEITPPCNNGAVMLDQGENAKCTWRRRRVHYQARGRPSKRVTTVDSLEPVLLFVKPLDSEKLAAAGIVPPLDPLCSNGTSDGSSPPYHFQGRIGRGGRLIFDRWNPLTGTPMGFSNNRETSTGSHPPPPRLNMLKESVDSDLATADDASLDKLRTS